MEFKINIKYYTQFANGDMDLDEELDKTVELDNEKEALKGMYEEINHTAWCGSYVIAKINDVVCFSQTIEGNINEYGPTIKKGSTVQIVKGRKYPLGKIFKVLKIVEDNYNGHKVTSLLGRENDQWIKTNIENCILI